MSVIIAIISGKDGHVEKLMSNSNEPSNYVISIMCKGLKEVWLFKDLSFSLRNINSQISNEFRHGF